MMSINPFYSGLMDGNFTFQNLQSHPVFSALSADIFSGQIIASLIVLTFVSIFLLREWISQNARPGVFEDDVDVAEAAGEAAAPVQPNQLQPQPDVLAEQPAQDAPLPAQAQPAAPVVEVVPLDAPPRPPVPAAMRGLGFNPYDIAQMEETQDEAIKDLELLKRGEGYRGEEPTHTSQRRSSLELAVVTPTSSSSSLTSNKTNGKQPENPFATPQTDKERDRQRQQQQREKEKEQRRSFNRHLHTARARRTSEAAVSSSSGASPPTLITNMSHTSTLGLDEVTPTQERPDPRASSPSLSWQPFSFLPPSTSDDPSTPTALSPSSSTLTLSSILPQVSLEPPRGSIPFSLTPTRSNSDPPVPSLSPPNVDTESALPTHDTNVAIAEEEFPSSIPPEPDVQIENLLDSQNEPERGTSDAPPSAHTVPLEDGPSQESTTSEPDVPTLPSQETTLDEASFLTDGSESDTVAVPSVTDPEEPSKPAVHAPDADGDNDENGDDEAPSEKVKDKGKGKARGLSLTYFPLFAGLIMIRPSIRVREILH